MADTKEEAAKQLREITECSICMSAFMDPKMLPCIHTFCFECIKRNAEVAKKKPGDKMLCPLCRKEFTIPQEGMNGVQKNFFMENLLGFKTTLQTGSATIICDVCNESKTGEIPSATMRCLECQDNYCDSCVEVHQFMKISRNHQVVKIGSDAVTSGINRRVYSVKYCSKHAHKLLDYYCAELKENVQKRKTDFLKEIEEKENAIHKRNQELKEMIDRDTKSLLDELSVVKSNQLKKIENELDIIDTSCTILKNFEAYCTELISKGSASDICSSVDELTVRMDELERDHEAFIGRPHQSVEISFQATDLGIILQNANSNIVGNVEETTTQFENFAIVVGLNVATTITRDVVRINLHRSNEISTRKQIPTTMAKSAAAAVYFNTMYVTGIGVNNDEIWKYSEASRWMKCASLVQGRRRHGAAFIDEVLYICGGFVDSNENVLDSVEAYDAATNKCTTVGKLLHRVRSSGNCVPYKSSLYIFGGSDNDDDIVSHVQVYKTKENTCTLLSKPMPRAYCLMQAVLWETSVILLGRNICFIFNIETETWQERNQFKSEVTYFGLVLDSGRVFVIGGGNCETDEDGIATWKCRDDVRYVPLQNILDDKSVEWKIHGKLPKRCLVHVCAKMRFPV